MTKKYKVSKSKYYSEEKKDLFNSYIFEYFSERINKWCILKNVDMKDYLKTTVTRGYLDLNEIVACDFDLVLGVKNEMQ